MKKIILGILILTAVSSIVSFAQTREPATAIRPSIVKTKQSMDDLEKSLRGENKVEDLIGGEAMQLRVAVQHDAKKDSADAEVHDASDDVFYVLEGSAELTLGGKLDNPREINPGEWRSAKITGGKTYTIKKGDLIVVPRGTPHQRINTKNKTFSLILIKVFNEPIAPNK